MTLDLETAPDPWNLISTKELFEELPEYPWLVKGLQLAPGRISLLSGYSDTGKTVVAMSVAMAVATGKRVWDVYAPASMGKVIHLNGEMGGYITRERYQRIARGMCVNIEELIASNNLMVGMHPSVRLDDADFEARLTALCQDAKLVVIDSLRAFSGELDENSKEIGQHILMLGRVSHQTGATFLVLHHTRKIGKDGNVNAKMDIAGSSSILGGAEWALSMQNVGKGLPLEMEHVRSPLGKPLTKFGVRFVDIEHEGDPRWGLRVDHVEGEQMAEEATQGRERHVDTGIAKDAESIRSYLLRKNGQFEGGTGLLAKHVGISKERSSVAVRRLLDLNDLQLIKGPKGSSIYQLMRGLNGDGSGDGSD